MTNANMSRRHDDGANDDARTLDGEITRIDPQEAAALAADDRGQRVGRIITTKDWANGRDPNMIIAGSPPGTRILLGSLRGVVDSTERSIHNYKDKPLESVWLNGEFEAVVAETGEVKAAPTAILPKAFGITIETAIAGLKRDGGDAQLTIDCDIGLEATGRPIPYEWIVIYYREGKAQKAMRDVTARQNARLARQGKLAITGPRGDFDAKGNLIDN
jgi:hypothetical protein